MADHIPVQVRKLCGEDPLKDKRIVISRAESSARIKDVAEDIFDVLSPATVAPKAPPCHA